MYALCSAPSSKIPLNDTNMFTMWKMTRTMRMGENTTATKSGSWKAEAQGAADLVEPRKLSPTPMV